ncbi:MAG: calcium-binding protein [Micavibrio sp.]|nr:calcium-binding protein [Micavibrio sp.]
MKSILLPALSAFVITAAIPAVAMADMHKGNHYMEKVDTNKDGKISKAESQAAHDARFEKMDTDGDGFVTKEEGEAAKAKMKEKWKEMKDKKGEMPVE